MLYLQLDEDDDYDALPHSVCQEIKDHSNQ